MKLAYYEEEIKNLVNAYFEENNLVSVELKLFFQSGKLNIRFLVDYKNGGIALDKCAEINQRIGEILDASGLLEESYILDVSSPGLDRPLRIESDFRRVIGKELDVYLSLPINGKCQLAGKLIEIDSDGIHFEVGNEKIKLKYNEIAKAKQKI